MTCVTANLFILHKMNPVAHSCRLHMLPTILRFAPSRSDVVCLLKWINHSERLSTSRVCVIKTVHSSSGRTSADVCLKKSLRSYMIQTLNIRSWCTVSIAIPHVVMVKTQILLCSSRLRVQTSTYKTPLASMWSMSCNIQHRVHQQCCYGGIIVPIINTTFIELSTAAYLNISFSPCLILRLKFSFLYNENSQSKPIPQTVPSVDITHASSSNNRSSEYSSNGNKPVFRYRNTR